MSSAATALPFSFPQQWRDQMQQHTEPIYNHTRNAVELEEMQEPGGLIVDFHGADLFPERWFDLVLVLRAENSILYPRLQSRCYSEKKLTENMEAEIMQVVSALTAATPSTMPPTLAETAASRGIRSDRANRKSHCKSHRKSHAWMVMHC